MQGPDQVVRAFAMPPGNPLPATAVHGLPDGPRG